MREMVWLQAPVQQPAPHLRWRFPGQLLLKPVLALNRPRRRRGGDALLALIRASVADRVLPAHLAHRQVCVGLADRIAVRPLEPERDPTVSDGADNRRSVIDPF